MLIGEGFNPTLVRLSHSSRTRKICRLPFQSHAGSIEPIALRNNMSLNNSFNPTLVRLSLNEVRELRRDLAGFNPTLVRLSKVWVIYFKNAKKFQSHAGSIERG